MIQVNRECWICRENIVVWEQENEISSKIDDQFLGYHRSSGMCTWFSLSSTVILMVEIMLSDEITPEWEAITVVRWVHPTNTVSLFSHSVNSSVC